MAIRILSLFFVLTFMLTSCDKSTTDPVLDEQLLFGKQWYLDRMTFNEKGYYEEEPILACQKDDYMEVKNDHTFLLDYSTEKCSANEPDQESFSWELDANQKILSVEGGKYHGKFKILELTATSVILEETLTGIDGPVIVKRYFRVKN